MDVFYCGALKKKPSHMHAERPRFKVMPFSLAQPFGHGEHPLPHEQLRKDLIDQVRHCFGHAPRVSGEANVAPFAGIACLRLATGMGSPCREVVQVYHLPNRAFSKVPLSLKSRQWKQVTALLVQSLCMV